MILLESPIPILFAGLVAIVALGAAFLGSRRVVFLAGIGAALAVVLLGVLVERLVVTEREEVENTLQDLAEALSADNADLDAKIARVLGFLAPSAVQTRAHAEWALQRYTVKTATVTNLKVTINHLTSPPSAECEFKGLITVADRTGLIPERPHPVHFTAKFRRHGDRWLLMEHTEELTGYGKLHGE
ncbi:MAG: hypothetical protein JW809_10700 [Pirellulales bacterium]|nr:hypothetical protein [Pirellulales bacterium]